ncbi:putative Squalene--hopene cyclase [Methylocella tundrae]|uniref:Putative Squalene--hopene cyclase n=1 Tax=Methylocella tundrae TaxID=227605 RepID=A0A4U8Z138_METTU|nr:putative Squalene--hopene cyclase [Methylocella tundrae]
MVIDNGNHLLLSGNAEALDFLRRVGGLKGVSQPAEADFAFVDLATKERWRLRPNAGPLPWWIFAKGRRVPDTGWRDYLGLAKLLIPGRDKRIDEVLTCRGALYDRLWRPFLLAALNTEPAEGSSKLAGAVVAETLARGGAACRPIVAHGLSAAFIEPAVMHLVKRGADVRLDHRLRKIIFAGDRAAALDFGDARVDLNVEDEVILATPPGVAQDLMPGLVAPQDFRAIVNAHFKIAPPAGLPPILGVVNGEVEWIFAFKDRLSVTISGADRLLDAGREELAARLWAEVAEAAHIDQPLPPWQIIKEKRATFAATPQENARRPRRRDQRRQSDAGRGLDGDRLTRDDRRRHPVRTSRGGCDRWPQGVTATAFGGQWIKEPGVEGKFGSAVADEGEAPGLALGQIEAAISSAHKALLGQQRPDGHFVFELEADVSIPAEYILFLHFLGDPAGAELEEKIAVYLRRHQTADDGWPLFAEGAFNTSSSVKAYFALKMIGDSPDAPHMKRARAAILKHGGAANTNVFTRSLLSLYGATPWRSVPVMPVELMHLPRWFPFHLSKISYWARTVLAPLVVVHALKPKARNPRNVGIEELFIEPADQVRRWPGAPHQTFPWTMVFGGIDHVLRWLEPYFPKRSQKRAIDKAVAFVTERLNGEDGLGAIYPAMAYSAMMFHALGVPASDPRMIQVRKAIDGLLIIRADEAYCQPCVSPVWDTALASHALMESAGAGAKTPGEQTGASVREALSWLAPRQVLDVAGDWATQKPHVRPGGWAFQYANPHYPDLDDTAVVVLAMDRAAKTLPGGGEDASYDEAISRAKEWILGLQSANGGFGAFDADNDREYLNAIPFADHGALLDPPTADVTARCVSMLAQLGETARTNPALARAVDYLIEEQEEDGSWFGRWGMNYIYGTLVSS